jgi:anionic cell wall polymer biosynthesis LytR-Cps2A-Psr (LCP) family protein
VGDGRRRSTPRTPVRVLQAAVALHPASARFRWDGENGPTLLIQTVEQLTGVRIDHYAAIDSDGLIQGPTT